MLINKYISSYIVEGDMKSNAVETFYMHIYTFIQICVHIYEKDLGHFKVRIYCAVRVYNCRTPLILVHQCKAKSYVEASVVLKILCSEPRTFPCPKSGYFRFGCRS